jgi:hypothetical protein
MEVSFRFDLGRNVRDKVTRVEGVTTGATIWLNGCKRYIVERVHDGKVLDDWFDEDRLEAFDRVPQIPKTPTTGVAPGGPQRDPVRGTR